jgi:hypothetical protein
LLKGFCFIPVRSIETKSKVHSFINDKREFLESLFMKHGKKIDVSEWSPKDEKEDFVWIDGSWFRRYLEQALSLPTPANQTSPSFPLPSIDAVGLCEHQVGLNPSNAHKGKWIRRSVFDAIEQFHLEKKRTLVNDINEGHNFEPVVLRSNFQCGICVETYCKRLHEKLCLVRNIVEVCDLLDVPVSNNVEVRHHMNLLFRLLFSFFGTWLRNSTFPFCPCFQKIL